MGGRGRRGKGGGCGKPDAAHKASQGYGAGFPQAVGACSKGGASRQVPAPLLEVGGSCPQAIEHGQPILHPITPLGLPKQPPPLPAIPYFVYAMPVAATGPTVLSLAAHAVVEPVVEAAPELVQRDSWTSAADQQARTGGRRDFFHTEGREHSFIGAASLNGRRKLVSDTEPEISVGTELELDVEEIHFGNPRIGVMNGNPAPMPMMLKWPPEKFAALKLECARIAFGNYKAWCAVGYRSNRIVYAMKRGKVERAKVVVVEPPPPKLTDDGEEEIEQTYGASIQGIQLVP